MNKIYNSIFIYLNSKIINIMSFLKNLTSPKNLNMKMIGIIILTTVITLWISGQHKVIIESFTAPLANQNPNCPSQLFTDTKKYYLFNYRQPVESGKNPIIFDTYQAYLSDYHQKIKTGQNCPQLNPEPPRENLNHKGKLPILTYNWDCNRSEAEALAKHRDCADQYYERHSKSSCAKFLEDNPLNSIYTNFDVESCMVKKFHQDYPDTLNKDVVKKVTFGDTIVESNQYQAVGEQ